MINQVPFNRIFQSFKSDRPSSILIWAVWFGLLTGLMEVAIRGIQKFVLGEWLHLSYHVVWMAPLADVVLFALVGLVLCLMRRWLAEFSAAISVFIFIFLLFWGPLGSYPRLHTFAALLLSVGLAVQGTRLIMGDLSWFHLIVRRTMGYMVSLVVVMALALQVWPMLIEREAVAKLSSAHKNAPNILLIVLDTVRAKSLSLYGYERSTTPNIERIAKTGIVFDHALSTSPWTLPSHASMFTGRFPHELSADWLTPLDSTYPTLAEKLSEYGYATAGFVANLLYCTSETGINRGFAHYEDYPISLGMVLKSSWLARAISEKIIAFVENRKNFGASKFPLYRKTAAQLNKNFLDWLSTQDERPFFAFLNYMDAHAAYLPPEPFDTKFSSHRHRSDYSIQREWSPEEIQVEIDAYEGEIAYLDHQLGLLFNKLKDQGRLDKTLVVIVSDHGEQFGEHGLFDHANSLYRPLLHIPLVISFPSQVPAEIQVREPVSLADIPATVLDLVGVDRVAKMPGNSLARYWSEENQSVIQATPLLSEVSQGINLGPWQPVSKGDMKSLVADGFHYIRNGDGIEELYDFENDPEEKEDLSNSEFGRQALARFRETLRTKLVQSRPDPRQRKTDKF